MVLLSKVRRAIIYSILGFASEVVFSALHDLARDKDVRFRTHPWMLPIYALIAPLYEPVHDALRDRVRAPARGAIYGAGFLAVEYAAGATLRRYRGEAPWDYSYAHVHIDGLIRPDYFVLWGAAGLALEPLHDRLTRMGPPVNRH